MSEQERQSLLGSGHLLSLTQAAKSTPYSAEYLSLLARKGKFPAIKIARNWITSKEVVQAYVKAQQKLQERRMQSFYRAERGAR